MDSKKGRRKIRGSRLATQRTQQTQKTAAVGNVTKTCCIITAMLDIKQQVFSSYMTK